MEYYDDTFWKKVYGCWMIALLYVFLSLTAMHHQLDLIYEELSATSDHVSDSYGEVLEALNIVDQNLEGLQLTLDPILYGLTALPVYEVVAPVTVEEVAGETSEQQSLYDDPELLLFAALIDAEVGDQNDVTKRLVIDVVLNRRDKRAWPDTIEGVIYQRSQFSVVKNGALRRSEKKDNSHNYDLILEELADRSNTGVVYFDSLGGLHGHHIFKSGSEWFGYE